MLQEAVDRLRSRVAELENEPSSSRHGSSSTSHMGASGTNVGKIGRTVSGSGGHATVNEMDDSETTSEKLAALSELVTDLREELVCKEEMIVHERMRCEQSVKEHTRRLEMATAECSRLKQELARRPLKEGAHNPFGSSRSSFVVGNLCLSFLCVLLVLR